MLLKGAIDGVTIEEVPGSLAHRLVVCKAALEVDTIRVDPLASHNLTVLPLASHLHPRLLEAVCAVALLDTVLVPAGVDIAVLVGELALAMHAVVLPVALVVAFAEVLHLTDARPHVVFPAALIHVLLLPVAVDSLAAADALEVLSVVDVAVLVVGCGLACVIAR